MRIRFYSIHSLHSIKCASHLSLTVSGANNHHHHYFYRLSGRQSECRWHEIRRSIRYEHNRQMILRRPQPNQRLPAIITMKKWATPRRTEIIFCTRIVLWKFPPTRCFDRNAECGPSFINLWSFLFNSFLLCHHSVGRQFSKVSQSGQTIHSILSTQTTHGTLFVLEMHQRPFFSLSFFTVFCLRQTEWRQ